ncbi:MAG: TlpA family protein disulfide reductase [Promethearchaeota archaeon]
MWDKYGTGYIPTMYIIDQNQTIVYSEIGFYFEDIINKLQELLLESTELPSSGSTIPLTSESTTSPTLESTTSPTLESTTSLTQESKNFIEPLTILFIYLLIVIPRRKN